MRTRNNKNNLSQSKTNNENNCYSNKNKSLNNGNIKTCKIIIHKKNLFFMFFSITFNIYLNCYLNFSNKFYYHNKI